MPAVKSFKSMLILALPVLLGIAGLGKACAAIDEAPSPQSAAPGDAAAAKPASLRAAPPAPRLPPADLDKLYPFYMPMGGLRQPAIKLTVKCDASRAAGREVYAGRDGESLYGRAEGGYEFIYEALDSSGRPCVYPFAPWMPQIVGSLQGTQYILRSSIPGQRVTFRSSNEWATIDLRMFDIGQQRVHFEMRDIELDFPGAVQPMGAVHLEAVGTARPGLLTAVIRRSKIYGGKNALFVPGGQTMLYIEDSELAGNVGSNVDQEHTSYINGILVSHFRNTSFHGQLAWQNIASGHQIKDKAYLRIYENVTVSNRPNTSTPSAMPLIDASSFGFTWSDNLHLQRVAPAQAPRDALIDLRSEILYGAPENYPWNVLVDGSWRMPASPLTALDKVYLSVFLNTTVDSFRTEPYAIALRPQGTSIAPGTTTVEGNENTTRAQQRMVSLAFNTTGRFKQVYSNEGWTFTDPELPAGAEWVTDRDAFIRHALGLIGR
ncbi:hypothetical protein [Novosphingobium sp. P6W]|uniref:hypothetical protein n=1 Tax=Novosphingobium sp. P6W TaxID=1609758 RepID=UPI000AE62543|nr:hypothetical protein [Novosphingobium sp. P6W]